MAKLGGWGVGLMVLRGRRRDREMGDILEGEEKEREGVNGDR